VQFDRRHWRCAPAVCANKRTQMGSESLFSI
jgi:hypothetical protein